MCGAAYRLGRFAATPLGKVTCVVVFALLIGAVFKVPEYILVPAITMVVISGIVIWTFVDWLVQLRKKSRSEIRQSVARTAKNFLKLFLIALAIVASLVIVVLVLRLIDLAPESWRRTASYWWEKLPIFFAGMVALVLAVGWFSAMVAGERWAWGLLLLAGVLLFFVNVIVGGAVFIGAVLGLTRNREAPP